MPHAIGTDLGGIRDLEGLRLRCVCQDDGHWHLRRSHGGAMPRDGRTHCVWVSGRGSMSAVRAAWEMATGKAIPAGHVVVRKCDAYDCVNPGHLRCLPKAKAVQHQAKRGCFRTPKALAQRRSLERSNAKLTPELRRWLLESPQSGVVVAHALGITQSRANAIRAEARQRVQAAPASIFALGQAMAEVMAKGRRPLPTAPARFPAEEAVA